MGLLCGSCSEETEIADIPLVCGKTMGQIQKAVMQRIFSSGSTKNTIADPTLLASWTPLLAASDGTKVVQTPYITDPNNEPGEARTYGGGNETRDGIELIIGTEPTTFTGKLLSQRQDTIEALKKYACENVGTWLVDEHGNIGCLADDVDSPTTYYPIPVYAIHVGDLTFGNFEGIDFNGIQWKMKANWSDKFVVVTPSDFNALTDLITP